MYRIGLTGGVGSGKSTVSSYMKELGIPVIDGDRLAQEAVQPGSEAMCRIKDAFGEEIFCKDGTLNRAKMAEIIFADDEKRQLLNHIIHPYIWGKAQEQLLKFQEEGKTVVVLDMPLLLEISWQLRVEEVWVVKVPVEVQIKRVIERNGMTEEQVRERIRNQMPTENKLNYADVVIDNSYTVENTKRQVREALSHVPGFIFPKEKEVTDGERNE